MVKTTPPAIDSPADPIVCTMLFSRMVAPPSFFNTEIASTAIGIDALTVSPARRPRYTVEAPKRRPKSTPRTTALTVNSAGDWLAGTYGWNAPFDVVVFIGVLAIAVDITPTRESRIEGCGAGVGK